MHVGVFLPQPRALSRCPRLPHARGGVSGTLGSTFTVLGSSPCTWGCFYCTALHRLSRRVFPMHVGVFLIIYGAENHKKRLPHARGGVSSQKHLPYYISVSSPCTWGCFRISDFRFKNIQVFPMHVGVFLNGPRYIV